MSDKKQEYVVLDKEQLELCLNDLGKCLHKMLKGKSIRCEIIVVGGASIILNYGFRLSTGDVDCVDEYQILMNDAVNQIANKYGLSPDWINTSFKNTSSYSDKLARYSTFYKEYGYGALSVRTIKDEYLLAMKIVSARKYKNDYSDIYGVIQECRKKGKVITVDILESAIIDLYDSLESANDQALSFAKSIILNPDDAKYESIRESEKENAKTISNKISPDTNQESIEYILSKLDIK